MGQAWKTVRVFISSTFKDMNAERDHLVNVVFPELEERMARRLLHLRAIDLRWGVLKEEDSLDICLGVIEDCRPYFIGLLGNRYGFVPPPPFRIERTAFDAIVNKTADRESLEMLRSAYSFDDYSQHYLLDENLPEADKKTILGILEHAGLWGAGHSITAQEIFRGVLDDQQQQMLSHFYFRNKKVTEAIPEPYWAVYNESDPVLRDKLTRLKERIHRHGLEPYQGCEPRIYDCAWDDDEKRITDLEEFGRMVLEDLWDAISSRYPEGHQTAKDPLAIEREAMEYMVETRSQNFVGRDDLREEMFRFVEDRLGGKDEEGGLLCVLGEAGAGKSAALANFYQEFSRTHPEVITIAHFVGASAASTNVYQMLIRIWSELNEAAGLREEMPAEFYEIVRALPAFLDRVAEIRPVCIVIDAINQLEAGYNAKDMRWLPEALPRHLVVILSTLVDEVIEPLRRRAAPPRELVIGPLGDPDVRGIIQKYLDQHFRKLSRAQIKVLLDKSSTRNPLYLTVALEELRVIGRYDKLIDQIDDFPDDIPGLFESLLVRLEGEHGRKLVRDFLSLIAIGRGGQAEEDLRALLKPEGEPRLPDLKWARLFRSLQFYLLRRSEFVDFYHQQLREAAQLRFLTPESRRDYHETVARYLSERGISYPRSLGELAYHLKQAEMAGELYALIDNPDFRQAKVSSTRSVYSLCSDVGLALDAAFERDELSEIGHFGFMHADYSEGRFGKENILELHRHNRKAALQEVGLLPEAPRFRMLTLLAAREAEAGQRTLANELIQDAVAIHGVKLPESAAPFLAYAVGTLLKNRCPQAPELLTSIFQPTDAAGEAARIASGLDAWSQSVLLGAAIGWLKQSTKIAGKDEKLLSAFESVARATAGIEDADLRQPLFGELEETIETIKTGVQDATEAQDTMLFALIAAISVTAGGSGVGSKQAALAHLGAALVQSGNQERGYALLEHAIDGADEPGIDSFIFGLITRALRTIPSSQSTLLLRRLVAKAAGSFQSSNLRGMLGVLVDDQDGSTLGEVLEVIAPAVRTLPIRQRSPLMKSLALAYARAGQVARARLEASNLDALAPQLSLVAYNPFVSAEHKLATVRFEVELEARTGRKGAEWTRIWLNRIARWVTRLDSEKSRVSELKHLLTLSGQVGETSAISAGLRVADGIRDEALQAEALEAVLDASKHLAGEERAALRDQALERASRVDESARSRIWGRWLETAVVGEIENARTLGQSIEQLTSAVARTEALSQLAGAMARLGSTEEAGQAWFHAAMADLEASTQSPLFASRVAVAARESNTKAWQEVVQGAVCPDPEVAAELVVIAADACEDAAKMTLLEKEVRKLRSDRVIKKHISRMCLALARGWARLGDPRRAARLVSLARKAGAEFSDVIEITPLLLDDRKGRELVLRMIPGAYYSGPAETNRFEKLAEVIAKIREEDWARECFRQLYLSSLERNSSSKWRDIEARASVIKGVAEWGQARLAYDLARAIPIPEEESSEGALLQPAAKPSALAQLGSAFAEIHRTDPRLSAITEAQSIFAQAVSAAAEVTGDMSQGEVCAAQIKVWIEARRAGLPIAHRAEWEAGNTAQKMAAEKHVSKWRGLTVLARAKAEMGEGKRALELARRIADEKDHEELIVELAGKLAGHSFMDVVECWREISTSGGRRRAAWNIAKGLFDSSETSLGRASTSKTTWSPFSTFGTAFMGGFLPGLILLLGLPASLYWLVWKAIPLVKGGLSGTHRSLWLAGVSAAALVALIALSRSLRNDVRNIFKRLGLSALLIAVSPFLLGYLLFEKYQKLRPSLRVKKFLLRKLLSGSPRATDGALRSEAVSHLDGYRKLLRGVVSESGPFDILFGSMLYHLASVQDAASLSARLPEMRLPDEIPEKIKKDRREYEEIERSFRKTYALRKALVDISSKVGIWITGGVLAPVVLVTILWRNNRERRAHRVAARGDSHLNAGRYDKAVRLLRRATRLSPDIPHYWHDYSVALSRSGKTEESVKAHREATQRGVGTRDEPQFWYALGYTLFNAGRYEEALEAFDEVLKIAPRESPDYTEASRGRDYCLTNLGRSMSASG